MANSILQWLFSFEMWSVSLSVKRKCSWARSGNETGYWLCPVIWLKWLPYYFTSSTQQVDSKTALDLRNPFINIAAILRNRVCFSTAAHFQETCMSWKCPGQVYKYYFLYKPAGVLAPANSSLCFDNHLFWTALTNILRTNPLLPSLPPGLFVL